MLSTFVAFTAVALCVSYTCDTISTTQTRIFEAALSLSGAASEEDLSAETLDEFEFLSQRPLSINRASRSRLLSSGLFSPYQVASLIDYRERNGNILSLNELRSVNGFDEALTSSLEPFILFESSINRYKKVENTIRNRVTYRSERLLGALRYGLKVSDSFELNIGARQSEALGLGFSLSYENPWKRRGFSLEKVIFGDFNIRFGQGLALWSGFSMSGFGTIAAFCRNPTGISPYRGWSSSSLKPPKWSEGSTQRGIAAQMSLVGFTLTAALSFPKANTILPAVNLTHTGRFHRVGISTYLQSDFKGSLIDAKISVDGAVNIRGVDLWSELALDLHSLCPAFVVGTKAKVSDGLYLAALGRYYPSRFNSLRSAAPRAFSSSNDEHGAALSLEYKAGEYLNFRPRHLLDFSFDLSARPEHKLLQLRAIASYSVLLGSQWQVDTKFQWRLNRGNRFELRCDLSWKSSYWKLLGRLDLLKYENFGVLGYVEASYEKFLGIFLRVGAYSTSSWKDRIYCYERDAPGGFNIPAFYGKGIWSSLYLKWSPFKWMKLYARGSIVLSELKGLKPEGTVMLDFRF